MFLIDTHCHINKKYYPKGLDLIFKNALDNNVKRLIQSSENVASAKESLLLAKSQKDLPEIRTLAGVHPHEARKVSQNYISELEELAANQEVIAIGEIGLDFYYDNSPRDVQIKVFKEQIELAKKVKKPIVLHIRAAAERSSGDAYRATFDILRESYEGEINGVIHCFSGDAEDAKEALELGLYISFAGPITYPKNDELRHIATMIPTDRILCETDSPYLAPQKFRGRTNEPAHVKYVYELLAILKEEKLEDFSQQIAKNVEKIFNWSASDV